MLVLNPLWDNRQTCLLLTRKDCTVHKCMEKIKQLGKSGWCQWKTSCEYVALAMKWIVFTSKDYLEAIVRFAIVVTILQQRMIDYLSGSQDVGSNMWGLLSAARPTIVKSNSRESSKKSVSFQKNTLICGSSKTSTKDGTRTKVTLLSEAIDQLVSLYNLLCVFVCPSSRIGE